jgi:hypothetical protein
VGIAVPEDLMLRYTSAGQERVFRHWPQSTQRLRQAMELPPSIERQGGHAEMIAGRKGYLLTYTTVVGTK